MTTRKQKRWMLIKAIMYLLSMAAFLPFVKAQNIGLNFQHLDRDKGLSQGTCTFISKDSRGFMWLATGDGLNRYDGQSVKVYRPKPSVAHSMVGNIVTSACFEEENGGDMWFTTYNAIHRYVRLFDHFDTFQVKSAVGLVLNEDYYAFYLDDKGLLWLRVGFGKDGTLHCFDTHTGQDRVLCPMNGIRTAVILDQAGEVRQLICSALDSTGIEIIDLHDGFAKRSFLNEGANNYKTHEVYVENDTLVWIGLDNGIAAFNPRSGKASVYNAFEGLPTGDVWSVCPYKDRLLFVATQKKGLWLFDRASKRFTQRFEHEADNRYSLMDNEVKNLFVDRQDNLWAAHWKYGLSHVNLLKNKFYIPPTAKGNSFWHFMKGPDGNIWCHAPKMGYFVYAPNGQLVDTVSTVFPEVKESSKDIGRLFFPKKGDWGFSKKYLLKWDGATRVLRLIERLPFKIVDLFVASDGGMLVISGQSVYRLAFEGGQKYRFDEIPFLSQERPKVLSSIFTDSQGRVYLSDNFERLLVYKNTPQGLVFLSKTEGIGTCTDFLEMPNEQEVWATCNAGLLRISSKLESTLLTEAKDGLPNATYYGIKSDKSGCLWLSSNQGLLYFDFKNKISHRYMVMDGLFGAEFNEGAFYQSDDHKIWAGGVGGLVIFDPERLRPVPFEPSIQITKILANDLPLENAQSTETIEYLDLPYKQRTLSFEFVALEFSDPSANQYQYRLLGAEEHWVHSGTRGFVRYANLPPGNYTLEILAANADGVWSTLPKRLKIHIQTPFYQTWWFYLLCAFGTASIVYAWFWYRLQQALKIERMRVQISSDLHDDVGTLLAGLAMQSEALELTAPDKDKRKLQRISEISRNAMGQMRDTVWAIDARKDKFENLLDRMREHAEETLTPRDIRFDIQVDNVSLKQNLPTQVRQNLYLIYKEAITNVAKHSNGNTVQVAINKHGADFEMRICDNGTASEKAYKTTGAGTSNMQMRAQKIAGNLEFSKDAGFCVVFKMVGIG